MNDPVVFASHITALMGHDLKQPARQVRQWSDLLKETLAPHLDLLPPEAASKAGLCLDSLISGSTSIHDVIERLMSTSQAILLATQGPPGCPRAAAVMASDEIVASSLWLPGSFISIEIESPPPVALSHAGLVTVWTNLISNACKYSPGEINIKIWNQPGQSNQFFIADRGRGIKAKDRKNIFALFQRSGSGVAGHGVGLALCRMIIESVGGTIELTKSRIGRGSTFSFTIPIVEIAQEVQP